MSLLTILYGLHKGEIRFKQSYGAFLSKWTQHKKVARTLKLIRLRTLLRPFKVL
jgi:hypothetical protein